MSNILKSHQLFGQRTLFAVPLFASIMAFGCTTDRTLGNGNLNDYSGVRSAPTSGVTTGSQTAPTVPIPPPMTSSSARPEVLPPVQRTMEKLTPDEAALIMADRRPTVRVLGPVSPASSDENRSLSLAASGVSSSVPVSTPFGTASVSREGTTIVPVPMTARNINPASTATEITPASTARSIQPVSTAVNVNPTPASTVRIVSDGRGLTVTNQ